LSRPRRRDILDTGMEIRAVLLASLIVFSAALSNARAAAQGALLAALDADTAKRLGTGEYIVVSDAKGGPLLYERIGAETLKKAVFPAGIKSLNRVECLWSVKSGAAPEALFARLHQVSRMKGMRYYSRSSKAIKLLVESAAMVDSASGKPLPDPSPAELKDFNVFTFAQTDTKFGANAYVLHSQREGGGSVIAITNRTDMKYGIIPAIKAGKLTLLFSIEPTADGYILYSGAFFDTGKAPIPAKELEESLVNRLKAIGTWLFEEN
jgi:hypothetical protein